MIFPVGSIFIFRLWVCEADNKGNLQGHLVEALEAREGLIPPTKLTEDLTERLTVFKLTQDPTMTSLGLISGSNSSSGSNLGSFKDKPSPFPIGLRNTALTLQEINSNLLQVSSKKPSCLPTRLNNMANTYQDLLQNMASQAWRQHLTGALEGLVLTVTS
jgi:hypothetical protein